VTTTSLRALGLLAACALCAGAADAQTPTPPPASSSAQTTDTRDTRPATTTFFGDTGIWFVPTAEVTPDGKIAVTVYRRGTNYIQGYTNVGDLAGTFSVGIKNRAEIFGSFLADTRIDRDTRPLFFASDPSVGGIVDRYPGVHDQWTGDNVGDLYLGAKINLWSEYRRNPAAIAIRMMVKAPTGKSDVGTSTGKPDFSIDAIVSKEASKMVEVSAFGGYQWRGKPDGFTTPGGAFQWGAGLTFPSRNFIRAFAEVNGDVVSGDTATIISGVVQGTDHSFAPPISTTENLTRATIGITAQAKNGFFVGIGGSWNVPTKARDSRFTDEPDVLGDYFDYQVRIGYHPGVRVFVPPPPPPPPTPTPPPPPPPAVHNLSVRAACDPCTVEIGKASTVTATAQSSIGCAVTYRWSAAAGTLAQPAERSTLWTAGNQEGSVPVTVTVTCASDGKTASDTTNIRVVRPTVRDYTFEDVHFDFDRYTLRPEATRVLDEAVAAMRENATLRLTIEGHTCNIGTAEYNLALGDRRANAVKDYLASRGIGAERLQTISYGEERPKYDNSREETRRLNRRAALIVRLQ
jgi:peptidoglycan-associated lipoprotein